MCIKCPSWNMVVLLAGVWFSFQAQNTVAFPGSFWLDPAKWPVLINGRSAEVTHVASGIEHWTIQPPSWALPSSLLLKWLATFEMVVAPPHRQGPSWGDTGQGLLLTSEQPVGAQERSLYCPKTLEIESCLQLNLPYFIWCVYTPSKWNNSNCLDIILCPQESKVTTDDTSSLSRSGPKRRLCFPENWFRLCIKHQAASSTAWQVFISSE